MEILQPIHRGVHLFSALCGALSPKATTQNDQLVTCDACLLEMKAQEVEEALGSDDTVEVYIQGK